MYVLFPYTAKYDEVLKENVELYQVVTQLQHKVEKLEAVLDKFVTDVDSRSTNKRVETFKLELTGTERKMTTYNITIGYRQSERHWGKGL